MRFTSTLLAVAVSAAVGVAQGTIRNSPHDFSAASWNTGAGLRTDQVCAVCHIPHVEGRPQDRTTASLLWGRQLSTVTYTMYSSNSLNGTVDPQPTGSARLCLSCHDGSVALDLYHTRTTSVANVYIPSDDRIPGKPGTAPGTDFSADHPISITYNAGTGAGQDKYLRLETSPFPGTVAGQTIADILEGGKVQCSSCHDVHNVEVPTGANHLLRIANNDAASPSALCLACHIK
ncbi:MAG: hypothetical protein Fur0037_23500 [Planctomycetota bacterium]